MFQTTLHELIRILFFKSFWKYLFSLFLPVKIEDIMADVKNVLRKNGQFILQRCLFLCLDSDIFYILYSDSLVNLFKILLVFLFTLL